MTQAKATTTNGAVRVKSVAGIAAGASIRPTAGSLANEIQVNERRTPARPTVESRGTAAPSGAKLQTTNGAIRLSPELPLTRHGCRWGDPLRRRRTGRWQRSTAHYTAQTTNAGIDAKFPADPALGVRVESQGMGVDSAPRATASPSIKPAPRRPVALRSAVRPTATRAPSGA